MNNDSQASLSRPEATDENKKEKKKVNIDDLSEQEKKRMLKDMRKKIKALEAEVKASSSVVQSQATALAHTTSENDRLRKAEAARLAAEAARLAAAEAEVRKVAEAQAMLEAEKAATALAVANSKGNKAFGRVGIDVLVYILAFVVGDGDESFKRVSTLSAVCKLFRAAMRRNRCALALPRQAPLLLAMSSTGMNKKVAADSMRALPTFFGGATTVKVCSQAGVSDLLCAVNMAADAIVGTDPKERRSPLCPLVEGPVDPAAAFLLHLLAALRVPLSGCALPPIGVDYLIAQGLLPEFTKKFITDTKLAGESIELEIRGEKYDPMNPVRRKPIKGGNRVPFTSLFTSRLEAALEMRASSPSSTIMHVGDGAKRAIFRSNPKASALSLSMVRRFPPPLSEANKDLLGGLNQLTIFDANAPLAVHGLDRDELPVNGCPNTPILDALSWMGLESLTMAGDTNVGYPLFLYIMHGMPALKRVALEGLTFFPGSDEDFSTLEATWRRLASAASFMATDEGLWSTPRPEETERDWAARVAVRTLMNNQDGYTVGVRTNREPFRYVQKLSDSRIAAVAGKLPAGEDEDVAFPYSRRSPKAKARRLMKKISISLDDHNTHKDVVLALNALPAAKEVVLRLNLGPHDQFWGPVRQGVNVRLAPGTRRFTLEGTCPVAIKGSNAHRDLRITLALILGAALQCVTVEEMVIATTPPAATCAIVDRVLQNAARLVAAGAQRTPLALRIVSPLGPCHVASIVTVATTTLPGGTGALDLSLGEVPCIVRRETATSPVSDSVAAMLRIPGLKTLIVRDLGAVELHMLEAVPGGMHTVALLPIGLPETAHGRANGITDLPSIQGLGQSSLQQAALLSLSSVVAFVETGAPLSLERLTIGLVRLDPGMTLDTATAALRAACETFSVRASSPGAVDFRFNIVEFTASDVEQTWFVHRSHTCK